MPRFTIRHGREETFPVTLRRDQCELAPEALRHVGKDVFESDEDQRYRLYDAATAIEDAMARATGLNVEVRLAAAEMEHVPEALRHVAREVFGPGAKGDRLRKASEAVEEAMPSTPRPRT